MVDKHSSSSLTKRLIAAAEAKEKDLPPGGAYSLLAQLLREAATALTSPTPASTDRLTREQADNVEDEMRRLEADPATTLRQMRLFMQSPMPCGHAVGNLLTCPTPPFGCVVCGETRRSSCEPTMHSAVN